MEQKQLDEIDESFFGEEFVEEDFSREKESKSKVSRKEVKKEEVRKPAKENRKEEGKATKAVKTVTKKSESAKEKPKIEIVDIEEKKDEKLEKKEEISIKPATPAKTPEKSPFSASPSSPWADESDQEASGSSFWKAVTGILLVLLIFSIFTQGFRFSESNLEVKKEQKVSLEEVQEKVLSYVNNELLNPPYVATVNSSAELDSLYQFTLVVAGKSVDSYVTKDGKLFFPQALSLTTPVEKNTSSTVTAPSGNSNPTVKEQNKTAITNTVATSAKTTEPAVDVLTIPIHYRKWLFGPNKISVHKGDLVKLTLLPDTSNKELILPEFVFSIPLLGVQKTVSGITMVEFKATNAGTFTFECGDCKSAQKEVMRGTLIVS